MISYRLLRKSLAWLMPETVKGRLRKRLFGYRPSRVRWNLTLDRDAEGTRVRINDEIELRINDNDYELFTVRYLFQDNGDAQEEMFGFIEASRSARTLLDVGASCGMFALIFCALGKEKTAVAYEPSPIYAALAQELIRKNAFADRLFLRTCAIGSEKKSLLANLDATGFIRLTGRPSADAQPVRMTTIDDECARLNLRPDILKIDIEGWEWEALQGARKLLGDLGPTVFLECHLDLLEKRGIRPEMLCTYLEHLGYRFFSCMGDTISRRKICGSANAIYRLVARRAG